MNDKTKKRKLLIRIVSAVCLLGVLISVVWSDYKSSQAYATPYDALGSILLEMSFYFAGLAAGEKSSDMVKENPYKDDGSNSVTTNNARENYVKDCFPKAKMLDFGWNDPNYNTFIDSMCSIWAAGSYILDKNFCDKIWNSLPTDGTSALAPESFVTNHAGASILKFPLPSPDPDDDGNNNEEEQKDADILKLFNPETNALVNSAFTGIFSTKAFLAVYKALLKSNAEDLEKKYSGGMECDYTFNYWRQHPEILSIAGSNFVYAYDLLFHPESFPSQSDRPDELLYPLTFDLNGVPQIGFSTNVAHSTTGCYNGLLYKLSQTGSYNGIYQYLDFDDYAPIIFPSGIGDHKFGKIPYNLPESIAEPYLDAFRGRILLDPLSKNVQVWDDNIIDVDNLKNYQKWTETVNSGNYVLKDLLKLMKGGWKVEINDEEKEWEGIKNNGKTAKETLTRPDRAPQYEAAPGQVSFDSLVAAMTAVESQLEYPNDQPAYEFLGDPTPGIQPEPATNLYPDTGFGTLPKAEPGVENAWWGQNYVPSPNEGGSGGSGGGTGNNGNNKKPFVPGLGNNGSGSGADGETVNWYQRFPFCVPWDIYHFIGVFSEQKKAPKWDIPFKIKRLGVDEKMTFDVSKYEEVVKVIRVFVLLFYSSGLVLATRGIIKG